MAFALDIRDIRKSYGALEAVRGLTLSVEAGTVFSLLGPNGAGKTTLLRILTTLARPTSGGGFVAGRDFLAEPLEVRKRIGIVPQENNLDQYLTARENLLLHAMLHRMDGRAARKRADELLDIVGLLTRADDYPSKFSGGMRRRLVLARALMHEPEVLFLDEPTTGLDPQSRRVVWEYVQGAKGRMTVFLTTHYMDEAERLSDRVVIISDGKVLVDGSPAELKSSLATERILEVVTRGDAGSWRAPLEERLGAGAVIEVAGNTLRLAADRAGVLAAVAATMPEADILGLRTVEPTLEDLFLQLTGRRIRD